MNEAIKNLKNSEFWKIEKFQNYMMKYWLPLTEVSKVDMLLYGEMLIFIRFEYFPGFSFPSLPTFIIYSVKALIRTLRYVQRLRLV